MTAECRSSSRRCYDDADLKDAGIGALKKGVTTLKADGQGWEVDPRLNFRNTDTMFVKNYASCFFGTDLARTTGSIPSSLPAALRAAL
jgi:hypothetical protein